MRALTLSMCAFGPYKEKQTIDFRQLGEETLFLITGPTGAGKTTIFDAMCFALYGKASGDDREHDTLRSHFAEQTVPTEVSFRFTIHHKTYEVVRSPKQLKPKTKGEGFTEHPPQAELFEIINGEKHLICSKVKEVNDSIENLLQLDYEQFRKMVMIPQGEFRRLISENSKDREEILQKIFHTYLYDDITKRLVEESKKLEKEIEQLTNQERNEFKNVIWSDDYQLDEKDSREAKADLENLLQEMKKIVLEKETSLKLKSQKYKDVQNLYFAAKELLHQFIELDNVQTKYKNLLEQQDEINKERVKLQKAQNALELKGYEEQVTQRKAELIALKEELANKIKKCYEATRQFEEISIKYEQGKNEESVREELKETIRKMKDKLEKYKDLEALKKKEQELNNLYEKHLAIVNQMEEQANNKEESIKQLEMETDELQGLTEQFFEFNSKWKEYQQLLEKGRILKEEVLLLKKYRSQYIQIKGHYEEAKNKEKQIKDKLLELEKLQRQEFAAVLATSLAEGEACPVCGSTHHPNKAQFEHISIKEEEIDNFRKSLEKQEGLVKEKQDQFVEIQSRGKSQKQIVEHSIVELSNISGLDINEENIETRILEWEQESLSVKSKIDALNEKISQGKAKLESQKKLKLEVNELRKQLKEKLELLQQEKEQLVKLMSNREQVEKELDDPRENYDDLRKAFNQMMEQYENKMKEWGKLQEQYEQAKELKNRLDIEVHSLTEQLNKAKEIYEKVEKQFAEEVGNKGFLTLTEYNEAKLEKDELIALEAKIKTYDEELSITINTLKKLQENLSDKSKPDLDSIEKQLMALEQELDVETKEYQKLCIQLDRHEAIASRVDEILKEKKMLEEEYFDVGELAKLAKGDNLLRLSFERYVLSSFLDEILFQANVRLYQMTDHRYQLIRSDQIAKRGAQSGLDLEVIDYYTGQKRSVKTLSGGEGFKAALSLALGMADVVQAHSGGVELDTLFIDEGFGTLDELSLEQALNCLSDLQKGNRVLGIISHVQKLKEQIRAKVTIETSHTGSKVLLSIS
jgi:DNA repair protein SbcC/Rad50